MANVLPSFGDAIEPSADAPVRWPINGGVLEVAGVSPPGTIDPDAALFGDSARAVQVHIVKVDGAIRDSAVTDTLDRKHRAQMPAWSPDGTKLAVQWSTESGRGSRIAVVDLPTRRMTVLDAPPPAGVDAVLDEVPSWFPDGKRIVFQSNRGGNVDVWSIGVDGTGLRQLTGSVQPDGEKSGP